MEEYEQIIGTLSASNIFPKTYLDSILKADVDKLFADSINKILKINPGLKQSLLEYIISVVMADREIGEAEVNFV
ncbi:MAG: hypothetical protein K6G70_03730, partial [Bacteroidaceae bacterium]|nr:hypothetical protein [Bacteroidaceae bacterium]